MTMVSKVELFGGVKASLEGFVCGTHKEAPEMRVKRCGLEVAPGFEKVKVGSFSCQSEV